MALLLTPIAVPAADWISAFAKVLPNLEVRIWPEIGDRRDIEVAAITRLPDGVLRSLPNLKLIASLVAGQDVLLGDPTLPDVPIVRTSSAASTDLMVETALLHVLRHHCDLPAYQCDQREAQWRPRPRRKASERSVGVLGLGSLGAAVAHALVSHGFRVAGFVRNERNDATIEIFAGADRLAPFLARSEIIVNLLPLTPQTVNLFNRKTLSFLPRGAALINIGRGGTVVDDDLIEALDTGQLSAATLDVFREEPLPNDHPFWRHPSITVTPHVARRIDAEGVAASIADNFQRLSTNKPLVSLVDRQSGY